MPIIRDIMNECVVSIRPEDTLLDAVRVLTEHHLSGAPVVSQDGKVVGFISEPGLMDVLFDEDARVAPVSEFMTQEVVVVQPGDSLDSAAQMFSLYGIRRLPVVENGRVIGVVTRRDLLKYALQHTKPLAEPLLEIIPALGEYA